MEMNKQLKRKLKLCSVSIIIWTLCLTMNLNYLSFNINSIKNNF